MADEEQNLSAACTDLSSDEPITQGGKHAPGLWRHGNEALKVDAHATLHWNGTVLSSSGKLLALTFGHTPEECSDLARQIAATPDTLAEFQALYRAYVRLLEAGRDRIMDHGGDCDPVDRMEEGDPALIKARAAIAQATGATS